MAGDDLSISGISSRKLEANAEKFQVAVLKKAIDSQGDVAKQLIEASTATSLPDGVGRRLNTVA
jgi:hypothetical protein